MKMKKILASLLAIAMLATLVPFAAFAEDEVDTSFVFGSSYGSYSNGKVPHSMTGGIGGKAQDDTALTFTYSSEEAFTDQCRWQYPISHITDDFTTSAGNNKGIYFTFNMYADGGTIANVGYGSGYGLFVWNPDGSVVISQHSGTPGSATMERGKWHKIALSFNEDQGGRFTLYIDGKKVSNDCGAWGTFAGRTRLNFGLLAGSTKGKVAFDDGLCQTWYAAKEKYSQTILPNDVIKTAENRFFDFEDDGSLTPVVRTSDFARHAKNVGYVFSNESEVRLLNGDLTAEATSFEEVENLVVTTPSGAYYYYPVNEYVPGPIDQIGLEIAKPEGSGDNWLSEIMVINNHQLAVFSSDLRNLSTITSTRLIGQALTSTNGYTLSYVDENKQPAISSSVKGGYIKATKDGEEDIYIEIVKQINKKAPVELIAGINDKRGATLTSATGVAGKSADDVSHGFVGNTHSWTQGKYYFNEPYEITANPNGTMTYVFNVYVDGDAIARIGTIYGGAEGTASSFGYYCHIEGATGNLYGPYGAKGPDGGISKQATAISPEPDMVVETGRWHQIAVTYDKASNGKLEFFVDGKLIKRVCDSDLGWNRYSGLALGVGYEATSGKVLYDDIVTYNGFFNPEDDVVQALSSTDNFALDMDTNIMYTQNLDLAGLKDAILANTNASDVRFYADSTMSAEATELNADTYIMTTSANGLRFGYYSVKSMDEIPAPEFTFTPSTHVISVKTKFIKAEKDMTLYLATYTDDKTLINIESIPVGANELNKEISLTAGYGTDGVKTVKAFLWYDGIQPMAYGEIAVDLTTPAE